MRKPDKWDIRCWLVAVVLAAAVAMYLWYPLPNESQDYEVVGCKHQVISTCCVYGCDGYGCTTCMSCGKTLVAANTWEVK